MTMFPSDKFNSITNQVQYDKKPETLSVSTFEANGCNFYYGFGDDTGLLGLSLPAFQASVSLVLFS